MTDAETAVTHDFQADIDAIARVDAVRNILDVVCRVTGIGFAAVARVTDDRWVACAVRDHIAFGLVPGGELAVETTICHQIRGNHQAVVIPDVDADVTYCGHPTPALYGFKRYISTPIIRADGSFFGTLCGIDPAPGPLPEETVEMFRLFAELIAFHLDAQDQIAASEVQLQGQMENAELRDQFIAVLGHDLRNPLASIDAGAQSLQRRIEDERSKQVLKLMRDSVTRMSGLIDHVLDFARGRFGGGMRVERQTVDLQPVLTQLIDEARAQHPGRAIETRFDLATPASCDPNRVTQLLSNLVGNAISHGAPDQPVIVTARTDANALELAVSNGGEAIPDSIRAKLFQPFYRGKETASGGGLGLGLYIAAQIAEAHGGTLAVNSTPEETRFTFTAPST